MEIYEAQIVSMIVLGSASLLVGLLPACFANQGQRQWPLFLSAVLCVGGGVLLSTSICHILPEMRESLPENLKDINEVLFLTGFFLLFIVDEIVHFFYGDTHVNDNNDDDDVRQMQTTSNNLRRHSTSSKMPYGSVLESDPLLCHKRQQQQQPAYNPHFLPENETPSQLCHVGHQEPCHATPMANVGLLVALSVHALLEGLAVGLEDNASKILLLLGAIASHKLVVGFCLGMELSLNSTITFCRHFIFIFIFSMGSVAGIASGIIVSNIPTSIRNTTIPILQGLAGGTLLYVTVCEIIPRERARWHKEHNKRSAGIIQCISVIVGFVLMTTISKYLDHHK